MITTGKCESCGAEGELASRRFCATCSHERRSRACQARWARERSGEPQLSAIRAPEELHARLLETELALEDMRYRAEKAERRLAEQGARELGARLVAIVGHLSLGSWEPAR